MASAATGKAVKGKVVVITGSSDGIGARLAERLGAAGARVILVARTLEKLKVVGNAIREEGGQAFEYTANLSNLQNCESVVQKILEDHERVDIFVSNAGRSIRRSVKYQTSERFHDFQRLFALNFFGALRMICGVLPNMIERQTGHIIHVSSFAVPTRQSRFAGYAASKSAMDALLQSLAAEVASSGLRTSSVYMPLVATKMASGGKGNSYDHYTMLTTDQACAMVESAIVTKEQDIMDVKSKFMAFVYFFLPFLMTSLNARIYQLERERAPEDVIARVKSVGAVKVKGAKTHLKALGNFLWLVAKLEPFLVRLFFLASPVFAVIFAMGIFFIDIGRAAAPHFKALLTLSVQLPVCTLVLVLGFTSFPGWARGLAATNVIAISLALLNRLSGRGEDEPDEDDVHTESPLLRRAKRVLKTGKLGKASGPVAVKHSRYAALQRYGTMMALCEGKTPKASLRRGGTSMLGPTSTPKQSGLRLRPKAPKAPVEEEGEYVLEGGDHSIPERCATR